MFVSTKHILFCRDKIMFVATKVFVATHVCCNKHKFVTTKLLLRQAYFCHDKRHVLPQQTRVCCDNFFIEIKMILVAAPTKVKTAAQQPYCSVDVYYDDWDRTWPVSMFRTCASWWTPTSRSGWPAWRRWPEPSAWSSWRPSSPPILPYSPQLVPCVFMCLSLSPTLLSSLVSAFFFTCLCLSPTLPSSLVSAFCFHVPVLTYSAIFSIGAFCFHVPVLISYSAIFSC